MFDAWANAEALIAHYLDNKNLADRKGHTGAARDEMIYKYHHYGPT